MEYHIPLRAVSYNLLLGGLDGGNDDRLRTQTAILAGLNADIVALQECSGWDQHEERHLWRVAHELGMMPVSMVRSHVGDGSGHTTLLYRPSSLRLIGRRTLGQGVFHHALIRARFRPIAAGNDPSSDFLTFATHFSWVDGESRLREARWMTDNGGDFPGVPPRAILLGDLNTPDREPPDWSLVPRNLQSRYRLVLDDGGFGPTDQRAVRVLLNSGWQDPQTHTGILRGATVGYYYDNEPVEWCIDYGLLSGMKATSYTTYDTAKAREVADHLPLVLDVMLDMMAGAH
ncbi:endonuclease/exonuclease/phosphatase family protein [Streptomyces sp. CL12]|uniref:endonuclease/exonuclease/phosphatase family protein n=1 Tax=Streptomyces sp. CL12 TaxID=3391744 RepID=UPI003A7FCD1C